MNLAAETIDGADDGEELELRVDYRNVKRHWLAGRPLQNGTEVELRLAGPVWLRGTYEWSGIESRWPGLRVRLDTHGILENGRPAYAVMAIPPQGLLRWPRG